MSVLDGLLAGIVADPLEETRWLVLAERSSVSWHYLRRLTGIVSVLGGE